MPLPNVNAGGFLGTPLHRRRGGPRLLPRVFLDHGAHRQIKSGIGMISSRFTLGGLERGGIIRLGQTLLDHGA